MNPLAIDIRKKLIALGAGVDGTLFPTADWSIHANAYPAKPARIIAVYNTGTQHQHVLGTRYTFETSTFQLRVRGLSPAESEEKIELIHDLLERIGLFTMPPVVAGGHAVRYLDILVTLGPLPMGRDEHDWSSHVVTMKTFREDIIPAS